MKFFTILIFLISLSSFSKNHQLTCGEFKKAKFKKSKVMIKLQNPSRMNLERVEFAENSYFQEYQKKSCHGFTCKKKEVYKSKDYQKFDTLVQELEVLKSLKSGEYVCIYANSDHEYTVELNSSFNEMISTYMLK